MQESPQLRQERELARRNWIGCLLMLAVSAIVIFLVALLPLGIFNLRSQPPWVLLVLALGGLGLTLVIGVGAVVAILRITAWSMEGARQQHRRGAEVLQRTLPGVDAGANAQDSAFSASMVGNQLVRPVLYIIGTIIAYIIVNLIVKLLIPGAPGITTFLLMVALGGIVLLLKPSLWRTLPRAAKESPVLVHGRRLISGILFLLTVGIPTLGVIPLIGYLPVPGWLLPVVVLVVCTGVLIVANMAYAFVPIFWIYAAVKQCDYDCALVRAKLVCDDSMMTGFYRNLAGVIYLWAGRYEDAKKAFEQSIPETRREALGAGSAALENVGCALAWQGKCDEAIPMFEGSIAIAADQVMVYSDLAEAYLQQGSNLARTLELTDRALKNAEHSGIEMRFLAGYQTGQILATRAWALARSGRQAEAREMLARAFARADKSFKPVLAGVYWRAGQVMLALGEDQQAKEHFARGKQIDPPGHYGRVCTEAMSG